jgi:hypothetical protein
LTNIFIAGHWDKCKKKSDLKKRKQMTIAESLTCPKETTSDASVDIDSDMPDNVGDDLESYTADIDV